MSLQPQSSSTPKTTLPKIIYGTPDSQGRFKAIDTSNLSNSDKKVLEKVGQEIRANTTATGKGDTYIVTAQAFLNKDTGAVFKTKDNNAFARAVRLDAVKGKKMLMVKISKSTPSAPTAAPKKVAPVKVPKVKKIISEALSTEKSLHKNIKDIATAIRDDKEGFTQFLMKKGVKDFEIDLIFAPFVEAEREIAFFEKELAKINRQMHSATSEYEQQNALLALSRLYEQHYPRYTEALQQLVVAQNYFNGNNQDNRISEPLDLYFKSKGIQPEFDKKQLDFGSVLIQFVQRPPRHKLLAEDAFKNAPNPQANNFRSAQETIKSQNDEINDLLPPMTSPLGQSTLRPSMISPEIRAALIKEGTPWKKDKEIEQFVAYYNEYGKEIQDLESINRALQKEVDPKIVGILRGLAKAKLAKIQNLNNRFVRWGGVKKMNQFRVAVEKSPLSSTEKKRLNYGEKLNQKLNFLNEVYVTTKLSPDEAAIALKHGPFVKHNPGLWQQALKENGWSKSDIKQFNDIYNAHSQEYIEFRIAYEKANQNIKNPEFQKIAKLKLKNLRSIDKRFDTFGGFDKTYQLKRALTQVKIKIQSKTKRQSMKPKAKRHLTQTVLPSIKKADFHTSMLEQVRFIAKIEAQL